MFLKREKKTVPKLQLRDGIFQSLCLGQTIAKILYHIPGKKQPKFLFGRR